MTVLRWIVFLPVAFLCGIVASFLLRMGSFIFPEILQLFACGFGGAAGIVLGGLYVAPRRTDAVKWILIIFAALVGLLSALGSLLAGEDKMQAAIGISMLVAALGFSQKRTSEIIGSAQQLPEQGQ